MFSLLLYILNFILFSFPFLSQVTFFDLVQSETHTPCVLGKCIFRDMHFDVMKGRIDLTRFLGRSSRFVLDLLLRSMCDRFNYFPRWRTPTSCCCIVAWLVHFYVECVDSASNATVREKRRRRSRLSYPARTSNQPLNNNIDRVLRRLIAAFVVNSAKKKRSERENDKRNFWRRARNFIPAAN